MELPECLSGKVLWFQGAEGDSKQGLAKISEAGFWLWLWLLRLARSFSDAKSLEKTRDA